MKEKISKIMQTKVKLTEYPVDKFNGALEKSLIALKLAKDLGVADGLLTIEIMEILNKKLRVRKIPSLSVMGNAMKRAEKKGYVISVSVESGLKRQRKYELSDDGEKYLQTEIKLTDQKNDKTKRSN